MDSCNGEGDGDGDGDGGESFVSCSRRNEKVNEAVDDLLEEFWFFDNLLKKRSTMMIRFNSDPCPSSSNTSFIEKKEDGNANGLIRAPCLPTCVARKEEKREKESNNRIIKLTRQWSHKIQLPAPKLSSSNTKEEENTSTRRKFCGQSPRGKLQKAPSLPSNIGREDINCDENDSDARMSRLIQLAFANSTESLNPRHSTKGVVQSCGIPRGRLPRSLEVESNDNTNGIREMSRRYLNQQQKMMKKSLSALETEEVQGFRDLGFTFEKNDLSPSVISILPGLQVKTKQEEDNKMMRPYLSEAWLVQSCAPPVVPNCVPSSNNNSAEDMKAQLKFWARVVASNVR